MGLALVKCTAERNGRTYTFVNYISIKVARLSVEIQCEDRIPDLCAVPEILRVIEGKSKNGIRD